MIFWSDKRPITIDLLKRLSIEALAREVGRENDYFSYARQVTIPGILRGLEQGGEAMKATL
jgi:hypothetical protein